MEERNPDSMVQGMVQQLMAYLPFSEMEQAHVEEFLQLCVEQYYEPNEVIIDPGSGVPEYLYLIHQGAVTGQRPGMHGEEPVYFELNVADLFPVGAVLTRRAVSTTYRALGDCFCLQFPADKIHEFGVRSQPFMSFLQNHFKAIVEQSYRQMQQQFAAMSAQAQLHQNRLANLIKREPFTVSQETPLSEALTKMDEMKVGSILVTDQDGQLVGILTDKDLLRRVVLPQLPLSTPIRQVMTANPKVLDADSSVEQAAQLMLQHEFRHVPVVSKGQIIGMVSERDLFAFQRFSLGSLTSVIHAATEVSQLRKSASHISGYTRSLLSQGVTGQRLTSLVSYLNDQLTRKIIALVESKHKIDRKLYCWLALGSEGRQEQTIATDQDNALILANEVSDQDRERFLAFAKDVNQALAECGFPLCRGNVMASNPEYCRRLDEWISQCGNWIASAGPESLLKASIFFDFRPIFGNLDLANPLSKFVLEHADNYRFIKLLATNAMNWKVPLTIWGGIDTQTVQGKEVLDLKKHAIALVVDFARIYALANRIDARSTAKRLELVAKALKYDDSRAKDWIDSYEFLLVLRLRAQLQHSSPQDNPNAIDISTLSQVDRTLLKACLQVTKSMQQRLELDYVQ